MVIKKTELYSPLWASCDELCGNMHTEIQTLQQHLSKTRQIKLSMMQKLLTGKTLLV